MMEHAAQVELNLVSAGCLPGLQQVPPLAPRLLD